MANAYSIAVANNEYISPVNLQLVNTVLDSREQKYNANMAKIDAMIETYSGIGLAREEDKKLMYDNINVVLQSMEGLDKMALSNSDTIRNIDNAFSNALTPYLKEQLVNSAKIVGVQSMLAEKRKKNDGTYNERNVQAMYEDAGYKDYMDGKTDTIGEFNYKDYIDVNAAITEGVVKYAEGMGKESTYIRNAITENGVDYAFQEIMGESFSPEKSKMFIDNLINSNPNLQGQIEIDSRATYGGLTDDDFFTSLTTQANKQVDSFSKELAKIKAEKSSLVEGSEEFSQKDAEEKQLQLKVDYYKNMADPENQKNRKNVQYNLYKDNLVNNYSNLYSYNRIKDVKYNTLPMDIAKEKRQAYLDELKAEKLRAETLEIQGLTQDGKPQTVGTITEGEGEKPDETYGTLYQEAVEREGTLEGEVKKLLQDKDPKYQELQSEEERESYIQGLLDSGYGTSGKIDGKTGKVVSYDTDITMALTELKDSRDQIQKHTSSLVTIVDKQVEDFYNSMLQSYTSKQGHNRQLTLNQIYDMGATTEAISGGKAWKNLTDKERLEVQKEVANRVKQDIFGGSNDKESFDNYDVYERVVDKKLERHGGYSRGEFARKRETSANLMTGVGEALIGRAASLNRGLSEWWTNQITQPISDLIHGTESEPYIDAERRKEEERAERESFAGFSNLFRTSETLNDWSNAEFSTSEGQNAIEYWKTQGEALKGEVSKKITPMSYTTRNTLTLSKNSANKSEQAAYKDAAIQIVARVPADSKVAGGSVMGETIQVQASKLNEGGYTVTADVTKKVTVQRGGKNVTETIIEPQSIEVPASDMPTSVRNTLSTTPSSWQFSKQNPDRVTIKETVSFPANADIKDKMVKNLSSTMESSVASVLDFANLEKNLKVFLKTPAEYEEMYGQYLEGEDKKNMFKNLVNSEITVNFVGSEDTGYSPEVVFKTPKGEQIVEVPMNIPLSTVVNDGQRKYTSIDAISQAIKYKAERIANSK